MQFSKICEIGTAKKCTKKLNYFKPLQFQNDMVFPTAKESTVQPSSSFVMSKQNVKQTKAQVFDSSNYSVIKPNTQVLVSLK